MCVCLLNVCVFTFVYEREDTHSHINAYMWICTFVCEREDTRSRTQCSHINVSCVNICIRARRYALTCKCILSWMYTFIYECEKTQDQLHMSGPDVGGVTTYMSISLTMNHVCAFALMNCTWVYLMSQHARVTYVYHAWCISSITHNEWTTFAHHS